MTVQKNNPVEDTCAFNRHGGPAQFIVTASNGDNWSVCTRHVADMMTYLVESTQAAYPPGTPDVPWSPFTIEVIPSNFGSWGRTVVDRIEARSRIKIHNRITHQGEADRWANDLIENTAETVDSTSIYADEQLTARRFMLAGNGPTVYATFLFTRGGVDSAIVEVNGTGQAYTVIGDSTVEKLYDAFLSAVAS